MLVLIMVQGLSIPFNMTVIAKHLSTRQLILQHKLISVSVCVYIL